MKKEKWFFINISNVEVSEGFPNFYLQNLPQDCHYYKFTTPPSAREFERVLYDWAGMILLKNGVPSYSLVIIVSKPLLTLSPSIKKQERAITPFMYYLNECIERFEKFFECKPNYKIIFELDREIGVHAENAKGSRHSMAYYLDNQPRSTSYYSVADSWPQLLRDNLKQGVVREEDTNLSYLSRVTGIKYYRISLYRRQAVYLHYVFSFLQLFITHEDDIKKNIFTNTTIKGIEFEGNIIPTYIRSFSRQIDLTLDKIAKKLSQNREEGELLKAIEKEREIEQELKTISQKLSHFSYSKEGLTCESAGSIVNNWEEQFESFAKGIPKLSYDFNVFLNNINNVITKEKHKRSGDRDFWIGEQQQLQEEQRSLTQKVKTKLFDEDKFIENWREMLSDIFVEIREDVQRCPSQGFMITTLVVSLLFYAASFYSIVVTGFSNSYSISFLVITLIYLVLSIGLFVKYRNESINKIKQKIDRVEKVNQQRTKEFINLMRAKKENQLYIYRLGIINQNNQVCSERIQNYLDIEQKINGYKDKTSSIRAIAPTERSNKDFDFKPIEQEKPFTFERFFKVFDDVFIVTHNNENLSKTISVSKNNNHLNEDLTKVNNMNNALRSINIHTT